MVISWFIVLALFVESVVITIIIPNYLQLFEMMDVELPLLTKFVLKGPMWIWLLPMLVVGIIVYGWINKKTYLFPELIIAVVALLWVPLKIYGLYLPILNEGP